MFNATAAVREDYPTPIAPPPIVELAQQYVRACDHFERLQNEMGKLNEEMKQVDNVRRELREKLLSLINNAIDPETKASRWQ